MCKPSLDSFDIMPSGKRAYLSNYGWNFSKKACHAAIKGMRKWNDAKTKKEPIDIWDKDKVEELLTKHGIKLENNAGYNHVYVLNMARADFWKSSIVDEKLLALFVKDVIDDPDNEGGNVFRKYYADCVANGIPFEWDDMM